MKGGPAPSSPALSFWLRILPLLGILISFYAHGSENVPSRPFAQWADIAEKGQWIVGAVYEQSSSDHFWADNDRHSLSQAGEEYLRIYQGFFSLQYGLTERWTGDLELGYTSAKWRHLDGQTESTSGVMDVALGVRYQLFSENTASSSWIPTVTFRASGVLPGSYDQYFPFAPGLRAAAIQPELLLRKHFGWDGFGCYADSFYRWNRTTGNDQYLFNLGLLQAYKSWEFAIGWRHLQTLSGSDIGLNSDGSIAYPRDARENYEAIEAGVSYTTSARRVRYAAHTRVIFDGSNTDDKIWFGLSVDVPFGGKQPANPGP